MRRSRKGGSLWGKKRSKSLRKPKCGALEPHEAKEKAAAAAAGAAAAAAAADSTDYGQFYDKINAREKCDDLVLLEEVTNEGIVEVRLPATCCVALTTCCLARYKPRRERSVVVVAALSASERVNQCAAAVAP